MLLLLPKPLLRDGGMAEDHGTPEAEQLFRPEPEVVKRQRVAKERDVQRVCCWTVEKCLQAL